MMNANRNMPLLVKGNNRYEDAQTSPKASHQIAQREIPHEAEQQNILVNSLTKTRDSGKMTSKATLMHQSSPAKALSPPTIMTESFEKLIKSSKQIPIDSINTKIKSKHDKTPQDSSSYIQQQKKLGTEKRPSLAKIIQHEQEREISCPTATAQQNTRVINEKSQLDVKLDQIVEPSTKRAKKEISTKQIHTPEEDLIDSQLSLDNMLTDHLDYDYVGQTKFHPQIQYKNNDKTKQTLTKPGMIRALNQSVDLTSNEKLRVQPNSKYLRNSIQDYEMAKVRQKKQSITAYQLVMNNQMFQERTNSMSNGRVNKRYFNQIQDIKLTSNHKELNLTWKKPEPIISPKAAIPQDLNANQKTDETKIQSGQDVPLHLGFGKDQINFQHIDKIVIHARSTPSQRQSPYTDKTSRNQSPQPPKNYEKKDVFQIDEQRHESFSPQFSKKVKKPTSSVTSRNVESPPGNYSSFINQTMDLDNLPQMMIKQQEEAKVEELFDIEKELTHESQIFSGPEDPKMKEYVQMIKNTSLKTSIKNLDQDKDFENVNLADKSRAFRKQYENHEAVSKVISKIDKQFQNNKYKFKYRQKDPLDQILSQQEQIEKAAFLTKQKQAQQVLKMDPSTLQSQTALQSKQFKFPEPPKQTQQIYQSLKKNESKDQMSNGQTSGGNIQNNIKKDRKQNESQNSKQSIPQYNPHVSLRSPRYYGKEENTNDSQSETKLKFQHVSKQVQNLPALSSTLKSKFKREDYVWSSTSKDTRRGRDAMVLSNPSFGQIAQKIYPNNDLNESGTPKPIQAFYNTSLWNSTFEQMQQNVIDSQQSKLFSRGSKRFGNSSYRQQTSQQNSPRIKLQKELKQQQPQFNKNEKLALNQINKIFEATISPKLKRSSLISQSLDQTQKSFDIKDMTKLEQQFIDFSLTNTSDFILNQKNLDIDIPQAIKDYQKSRTLESSITGELSKRDIEKLISMNTSMQSKQSGVTNFYSEEGNPLFQRVPQPWLDPKGPKFPIGKLIGNDTVQKHVALNNLSQSMDFQSVLRDGNQSSNFESNKQSFLNHSLDLSQHLKDLRKNQLEPLLSEKSNRVPKVIINHQLDLIQKAAEKRVEEDNQITERLLKSKIDDKQQKYKAKPITSAHNQFKTIYKAMQILEPKQDLSSFSKGKKQLVPMLNLKSQSQSPENSKSDQKQLTNRAQIEYLKQIDPSFKDPTKLRLKRKDSKEDIETFSGYSNKQILMEERQTQNFNQDRINTSTGDRPNTRTSDSTSQNKEQVNYFSKSIDLKDGTNIVLKQQQKNSNEIEFAVKIEEQSDEKTTNIKNELEKATTSKHILQINTSDSQRKQFDESKDKTQTLKIDGIAAPSEKSSKFGREISCQLALDSIDDELPRDGSQIRISPQSPNDKQQNRRVTQQERRKVIHQRKGTQQLLNIKEQNLISENTQSPSSLDSPPPPQGIVPIRQNQIQALKLIDENGESNTQRTSIVQNTENQSIDKTQNLNDSAGGMYNKLAMITQPQSKRESKELQIQNASTSRNNGNQDQIVIDSLNASTLGKPTSKLNFWSPNQTDHNISGGLDQDLLLNMSFDQNNIKADQNKDNIQERDSEFSGSPNLMNKALYESTGHSVVTSAHILKVPENQISPKQNQKDEMAKKKFYTMQRNGLPIMQDVQIMPNQVIYNRETETDLQITQKTLSKNMEQSMLRNNTQINEASIDSLIMKQVNSVSSYNKSPRGDSKSPQTQKNTTETKAYYARQRCYDQPNLYYRQDPRQMQGRVQVNLTTLSKNKWADLDDRSTQTQVFQQSTSPGKRVNTDHNGLEHNFIDFNQLKLIGQNKVLEDKKAKVKLENQAINQNQLIKNSPQVSTINQQQIKQSFKLETSNHFMLGDGAQQAETDRYDTGLQEYATMNDKTNAQRPFSLPQNSRLLSQKYDSPLSGDPEVIANNINRSAKVNSPTNNDSVQRLKGKSIDYRARQSIIN